MIHFRQKS